MMNWLLLIGRVYAENIPTESELQHAADVGAFVTKVYTWVIGIGVPLGALVIIYAGYIYMTSQGNPDGIKTAKDIIIGVLVGYALIILAGVLLKSVIGVNP